MRDPSCEQHAGHRRPVTVFAPTNEAFAKPDQETLGNLLQNDMQQVTDLLLYHVAPGKITAKETTESKVIDTALPGAQFKLAVGEGGITINDKTLIYQ